MSTATAFDVKAAVIDRIKSTAEMYIKDLGFIPKDKLAVSPMGKARPALEFTAECAGFNFFVAALALGAPKGVPSDDERKAFYASIDTLEKATTTLQASVDQLTSALSGVSEEALFEPATAPWGEETTLYRLADITATHMAYHDGQLNYIQALYGDDSSHWH